MGVVGGGKQERASDFALSGKKVAGIEAQPLARQAAFGPPCQALQLGAHAPCCVLSALPRRPAGRPAVCGISEATTGSR